MALTVKDRPSLPIEAVRQFVKEHYGLDGTLMPLPAEWDQNFRLDCGKIGAYVIKIANQGRGYETIDFQNRVMALLSERWASADKQSVRNQSVRKSINGDTVCRILDANGREFLVRVLTWLEGQPVANVRPVGNQTLEQTGFALGELDSCLADFEHPAMEREFKWDLRRAEWISSFTACIPDVRRRGIVERLLLQFRARTVPVFADLPMSVIHNDANDENILLSQSEESGWKFAGLLDFGDMLRTHTVNELAIACAYMVFETKDPLTAAAHVTTGYNRARPLSEEEVHVLFPLICMRLCVSVTTSAIAAEEDPHNEHRQISDRLAWETLEKLEPIDWLEAENRFREACGLSRIPEARYGIKSWTYETLLDDRLNRIGQSLSLSYDTPIEIVRGRGQFLFGRNDRAYLDCVNNVCHVGHCHPKVVDALSRQASVLNTNTRYLHPCIVEYAERLTATLPDPLSVCFFVNSGSEANELAVRIARTYTGRSDAIVLEGGYHGNTQTLIDLSPYKCEGPGGKGLPEWVHKVVKPDPYRGPHRGRGEDTGRSYAECVREVCEQLEAKDCPPAFFLCEPILGCGGQIFLPEGYLRETFRHVRSVGGLCVVDEVQVGMGRVGSHWWAFETQDVVPDIVTVGKPIGNGHPLGAVITTPEIAGSFDDGMEFFSTFGGNPVSMAVGMAVLDVIEEEKLLEQAARVGQYLKKGFVALAERHPEIGDVRGLGLFMGVELVADRETREPATGIMSRLIERVKVDGILLTAEGPHLNILKIKPPMQFAETDADLVLGAVDRALQEIRQ